VLAGAGDEGSTEPVNVAGTLLSTTRAIGWPASDPLVTAVGGTQLHLNLAGKRLLPDNVWNDTNLLGGPAAGGGGLSAILADRATRTASQLSLELGEISVRYGTATLPGAPAFGAPFGV